jgi:ribosome biogenesis GTPase
MMTKDQTPLIARVIAQYRGKYRVLNAGREFWAEVTGKLMYNAGAPIDYPIVGDLVKIFVPEAEHAVISEVLPRKSILQRKAAGKDEAQPIAANIDTAFVVQALDRDFNLNRFERYLTIICAGKIKPVLVLNKTDLVTPEELGEKLEQVRARFGDTVILTANTVDADGIAQLAGAIEKDKIHCLLGSSGVGKSSLINRLLGQDLLKTREISCHTNKGRHVTTHRELFVLKNGGMIIDNPGLREIGLADAGAGVDGVFSDISTLAKGCRYVDCTHEQEPGCAVLAALNSGELSRSKYLNYLKLKKESAHYDMTALERRKKDRKFGKMVKNFKKYKKQKIS